MQKTLNPLEESTTLNLQFDKRGGLLPVAVQETKTGEILMIAYINKEALEHSLKYKEAAFWSTSRNELWIKGITSGNRMELEAVMVDCDQDALIYKVSLTAGGVCHTKDENNEYRTSCFYRRLEMKNRQLSFL